MRIGYDARILAHPKSGIATYLINLIRKIKIKEEVVLFSDKPIQSEYTDAIADVKSLVFGARHRKYWAQVLLPRQLQRHGIDIYHATWNNAVPVLTRIPTVLTIHDIAPWHFPEEFVSLRKELKYKLQTITAAHRAEMVLTGSDYSKRDIQQHLKIPSAKIRVIHYGVEELYLKRADEEKIKDAQRRFSLERDYLIYIGDINHPRKNIGFLIEAFGRLVPEFPIDLLIVGSRNEKSARYMNLITQIKNFQLGERVKFTGHISDEELFLLLSGAKAMVMPSLFEGFGIPLVEAMATGVPIVATNVTSIPEIVRDAGLLVEPEDIEGFIGAIKEILLEAEKRGALIERGWQRVKEFSWDKSAEETLKVYDEFGGRRQRFR